MQGAFIFLHSRKIHRIVWLGVATQIAKVVSLFGMGEIFYASMADSATNVCRVVVHLFASIDGAGLYAKIVVVLPFASTDGKSPHANRVPH